MCSGRNDLANQMSLAEQRDGESMMYFHASLLFTTPTIVIYEGCEYSFQFSFIQWRILWYHTFVHFFDVIPKSLPNTKFVTVCHHFSLQSALATCLRCSWLDPQHPPKILKLGRALLSRTYNWANSVVSPTSSSVAVSNSVWLYARIGSIAWTAWSSWS